MKSRTLPALLALPLAINVALAQDDEPGLEEIIVTAQKRTENVQDIPFSVSTLSNEKLDVFTSANADIRFLRGRVPSLNIESSFGRAFPRFYIRGYGNTDFDLNASQPVSLVYDEIVQENPVLKGFPIFDVERIETLRGPQGTLFGRNTPAGIVKVDSRKPTQDFGGYGKIAIGRYGTVDAEGVLNGGISDDWSARLSVKAMHRDDWVDNRANGEEDSLGGFDEFAIRAQAMYDSGGDFTALFNLHYRDLDGTARLFRANIIEPRTNELVDGFRRDDVFYDGENFQDLESVGLTAKLEWDLGSTTLTSVTGYASADFFSRGDIDGGSGAAFLGNDRPAPIPFDAQSADALPDHDQITQELRLASNEWGKFDWQAGLFFFSEDLTIDSFNYESLSGQGVQNGFATQTQETDAWALFGSFDYELNDSTTIQAGLRFSDDSKDFVARRDQSPLAFLGVGPLAPVSVSADDDEFSGDISINHYVSDDVNLYARVARGFRAPSIQGRVLFGDIVSVADSETILSVEGGAKMTFSDRARLNVSVYSYEVSDLQLTAVGGQTNFNTLINADEATGFGIELDGEFLLTDELIVSFGLGYNDTDIDDENLAIQPCGGGCRVLDPVGDIDGTVSINGNSLPQSPEVTANATVRWGREIGPGELYVFGDWFYRDDVVFFLYESAEFQGDALSELGLRVGYNWDDGKQEVALFGRNITDEEELVGGIDFNNLTGFVNEPRFWGAEYRYSF